jgi:hypothetical protein
MPRRVCAREPPRRLTPSVSVSAANEGMPFTGRRRTVPSGASNVRMKVSRSSSCHQAPGRLFLPSAPAGSCRRSGRRACRPGCRRRRCRRGPAGRSRSASVTTRPGRRGRRHRVRVGVRRLSSTPIPRCIRERVPERSPRAAGARSRGCRRSTSPRKTICCPGLQVAQDHAITSPGTGLGLSWARRIGRGGEAARKPATVVPPSRAPGDAVDRDRDGGCRIATAPLMRTRRSASSMTQPSRVELGGAPLSRSAVRRDSPVDRVERARVPTSVASKASQSAASTSTSMLRSSVCVPPICTTLSSE